ncbi:hypothetical protein MH215_09830 [Paenibacillus sp. ACRSA]|uniref:hypothetical protein n=1 Tax=Paenibacillus sp. ACRSA TaxID=2918211 RepID=UPI001EF70D7A|nr:hypothetical protein [Paenibacillus sp. ACRSA]MCG7377293.1 hypothetical protein [Paenibacillus sp. ACRSA]
MLTKQNFKKLKKEAKHEIKWIEQEYEQLQQKDASSQLKKHDLWDEEEIHRLTYDRKDRKYASWTIELCSIIEQWLLRLYEQTYQKTFNSVQLMKTPAYRSLSNIEILQAELKSQHIAVKSGTENDDDELVKVFKARNKLIHSNFSFASIVGQDSHAEQTLEWILNTFKQYRKHLKYEIPVLSNAKTG